MKIDSQRPYLVAFIYVLVTTVLAFGTAYPFWAYKPEISVIIGSFIYMWILFFVVIHLAMLDQNTKEFLERELGCVEDGGTGGA